MKQSPRQKNNQAEAPATLSWFERTAHNLQGVIVAAPILPIVFLFALCVGMIKGRRKS